MEFVKYRIAIHTLIFIPEKNLNNLELNKLTTQMQNQWTLVPMTQAIFLYDCITSRNLLHLKVGFVLNVDYESHNPKVVKTCIHIEQLENKQKTKVQNISSTSEIFGTNQLIVSGYSAAA